MTERQLQDCVMGAARLLGWSAYHTWLSRHSAPGFPDLILVRAGRLLAVELKSATGRLSAHQEHWLGVLGAVPGVACHVWRPADWLDGTIERALR